MTARRQALARQALALLAGAALALVPTLALAPAAHAAGSFNSPGAGAVFRGGSVAFEVQLERLTRNATQLVLDDPSGAAPRTVATWAATGTTAEQKTASLDTSCPTGCGEPSARNGTWTARLTGGSSDETTFVLAVPPAVPADLAVTATGPREVVVEWNQGREPDLRRYEVLEAGQVRATVDPTCPQAACRAVLAYDADGPSSEAIAVRAVRSCPACEGQESTATTDSTSVTRPAPPSTESSTAGSSPAPGAGVTPTASPRPGTTPGATPSPGRTGPGTTGASPSPGSGAVASGSGPAGAPTAGAALTPDQFALTFQAFGPKIGLPKLPPFPATGVAAPSIAPLADGTFAPELPFGSTTVQERVPVEATGPVGRVTGAVGAAVDSERLARGAAAALVLFLVVAHVRRFLAQSPPP